MEYALLTIQRATGEPVALCLADAFKPSTISFGQLLHFNIDYI